MVDQAIQSIVSKRTTAISPSENINDYIINKKTSTAPLRHINNDGPASRSPHQLDELAASVFMIRNNNNKTTQAASHHQPNKPVAAAGNVQPKPTDVAGAASEHQNVPQTYNLQGEGTNYPLDPAAQPPRDNDYISSFNNNDNPLDSYVYRDHAQEEDPMEKIVNTHNYAVHSSLITHEDETTRNLACQKLPAKLAAMLSDPDLITCITWLPHGRSWKILNRDFFSSYALPRYFGHTNHSSFVRVVNAWGFRRMISGPDKDSYYHELFLRGKPNLHSQMKRLPNAQRKTPLNKTEDNKCGLDFYELSKSSPLPENTWQYRPQVMNHGVAARMGQRLTPFGAGGGAAASGGGGIGVGPLPHGGGGMSSMMGSATGMVPGAAGMGMHHHPGMHHGGGAAGGMGGGVTPAYTATGMGSNPMMVGSGTFGGGGGWSAGAGPSGAGAASGGGGSDAAVGMMGMHYHPSASFDRGGAAASGGGGGGGAPADSSRGGGSSSSNTPQLLAALRQQQSENKSNASTIQSLTAQNQLLQALLAKTRAAAAAAGVTGLPDSAGAQQGAIWSGGDFGGAGGSGGYPYHQQYYSSSNRFGGGDGGSAPTGGGNDVGRGGHTK